MSRNYGQGIRRNWKQFLLQLVMVFAVGLTMGAERTVVPVMGEETFGIESFLIIGSFVISFGIVKAVLNLFSGKWGDVYGRKPILILGWLAAVPIPIVLIYAPSWWWIAAANVLLGVNQGVTWSMTQVSKLELAGPSERGLAAGLDEALGYSGVAVGAWLTGVIAAQYSLRPEPFYGLALVIVVAMLLAVVLVEETLPYAQAEAVADGGTERTDPDDPADGDETQADGDETQADGDEMQTDGDETQTDGDEMQTDGDETQTDGDETQTDGDETQTDGDENRTDAGENRPDGGADDPRKDADLTFVEIVRRATYGDRTLFAAAQAGHVEKFVDTLVWIAFPLYLAAEGLGVDAIGLVVGVHSAAYFLQIYTGRLADRWGRKPPIVAGMFVAGAGALGVVVVDSLLGYLVMSAVAGVGMALHYPNLITVASDAAHPLWRSTGLGVYRLWRDLGYAVGAVLIGLSVDVLSIEVAFYLTAVAMFVSGAYVLVGMDETHPEFGDHESVATAGAD